MLHLLKNHPLVAGGILGVGIVVKNRTQWRKGIACVRYLEPAPDGYIKVELDNNLTFMADQEHLQSLYAAKQAGTPTRYWINYFETRYGVPHGGIGER